MFGCTNRKETIMNDNTHLKEKERLAVARESFSGRLLTNAQFDEAIAITSILEREIKVSGTFKDKLSDYAHAFSRTQPFDGSRSESLLRDLFKERTGQTMNQLRETLAEREIKIGEESRDLVADRIEAMGRAIREGDKMTFHRAYAQEAQVLSEDLGITEAAAKRFMKEEFEAREKGDLYEWGKELEDQYYRPQIEAEKADRQKSEDRSRDQERPRDRERSNGSQRSRSGDETGGESGSSRRRYRTGPTP
jgi:hypothetical protein